MGGSSLHPHKAEDRQDQILSLSRRVTTIAKSLVTRLPANFRASILEDFVQAGWLGAIAAVDHYRPEKGPFTYYATRRITGAVLDYMRSIDYLSDNHRRMVKVGLVLDVQHISSSAGFDIQDHSAPEAFRLVECCQYLNGILLRTELPLRSQQVLRSYYWEGKSMKLIGNRLGVSKGRVFQIRNKSLVAIRQTIGFVGPTRNN